MVSESGEPEDDGFSALQLPFLAVNNEVPDWTIMATPTPVSNQETADDLSLEKDFLGHYALNSFGHDHTSIDSSGMASSPSIANHHYSGLSHHISHFNYHSHYPIVSLDDKSLNGFGNGFQGTPGAESLSVFGDQGIQLNENIGQSNEAHRHIGHLAQSEQSALSRSGSSTDQNGELHTGAAHLAPRVEPSRDSTSQMSSTNPEEPGFSKTQVDQLMGSTEFLALLPVTTHNVLYDIKGNQTSIDMTGKLSGNFFLSPSTLLVDEPDMAKYVLTFYRRNLFQLIASISNAHTVAFVGQRENPQLQSRVLSLSVAVSANGNDEKNPKDLLFCVPKGIHSGTGVDSTSGKQDVEPAVKYFYAENTGYDETLDWKRLQFKTATLHNGRRKRQNYFVVVVSLYAELENTQRICIATAKSREIIVRGRNPQFYKHRATISLAEGTAVSNATLESIKEIRQRSKSVVKEEVDGDDDGAIHDFATLNSSPPDPALDLEVDAVPRRSSNTHSKAFAGNQNNGEFKIKSNDLGEVKPSVNKLKTEEDDESEEDKMSKSATKASEDYEYFPMPREYWMRPVEVVYRPHAVHHPAPEAVVERKKRAPSDYFAMVDPGKVTA